MAPPSDPKERSAPITNLIAEDDSDEAKTRLEPMTIADTGEHGAKLMDFSDESMVTASVPTLPREQLLRLRPSEDLPTLDDRTSRRAAIQETATIARPALGVAGKIPSLRPATEPVPTMPIPTVRSGGAAIAQKLAPPPTAPAVNEAMAASSDTATQTTRRPLDSARDDTGGDTDVGADTTTQQRGVAAPAQNRAYGLPPLGKLDQGEDLGDVTGTVPTQPTQPQPPPRPLEHSHISASLLPIQPASGAYGSLDALPAIRTSASSESFPNAPGAVGSSPAFPGAPWNAASASGSVHSIHEEAVTPTWPWIVLVVAVALFCVSIPLLLLVFLRAR